MSATESPPKTPKPPRSGRSGEHPAVRAYRAKLESIAEGAAAPLGELDRALRQFLEDVRGNTPLPSKPK